MVHATRKIAAHVQEAGRTAHNDRGLGSNERGRLLRTNKKINSVFGTTPPSSFLQMNDTETRVMFPSSIPQPARGSEETSERLSESVRHSTEDVDGSNMAECAESLASSCVPPLNLRRRQHRKSQSMAGLTLYNSETQRTFIPPPQDRPGPSRSSGLVRSQSYGASTRTATSRPRPLPPLPRPAIEPVSRLSSDSGTSLPHYNTPRRLPTPPLKPSKTEKVEFPHFEDSHFSNPWPSDVPEDISAYHLSISTFPSDLTPSEIVFNHEPSSSTSSRSSSTTDIPATRLPKKPAVIKPPIPPRPARAHASPYKFVRNSYSTTSLSSQVSVPPVPPPTELRKRHRNKMAKLMRVLGDSPPPHMVFGSTQDLPPKGSLPVAKAEPIYEESDMGHSTMSHESMSKSEESYVHVLGEKEKAKGKGKSNPVAHIIEFGSRNRSKPPAEPRQTNRLRARPRGDAVSPTRRLVTMHADTVAPSKLSLMVMGKMGAVDVAGDIEVANIDVPDLPTRERVPSRQWLLEIGQNRREVQDYDNVVKSLRML